MSSSSPHHLLPRFFRFFRGFVWGGGGNQPLLGLPAPRLSPPGRPGQQAQVSHTAGSSSASCRRASEGHSPEATGGSGPAFRDSGQVGWPSGGRRAQPDLMPSLRPLRGEAAQVCPQKSPLRSLPTTSVPTPRQGHRGCPCELSFSSVTHLSLGSRGYDPISFR